MKYKSLNDPKQDNEISPEDVARFAIYENDLTDGEKFTGICDLVVACENSQTSPLKEQIKTLEARNKELEEAFITISKLYHDNDRTTLSLLEQATEIAEQALNNTKQV